eukprot:NODE_671_length_4854_cov_0.553312.p5 type:complete len:179 gc:universal NODE_671_length_4854_cov_0.553312:1957-2493(+)
MIMSFFHFLYATPHRDFNVIFELRKFILSFFETLFLLTFPFLFNSSFSKLASSTFECGKIDLLESLHFKFKGLLALISLSLELKSDTKFLLSQFASAIISICSEVGALVGFELRNSDFIEKIDLSNKSLFNSLFCDTFVMSFIGLHIFEKCKSFSISTTISLILSDLNNVELDSNFFF